MLADTSLTSEGWRDVQFFPGFYVYALYGENDELLYIGQSSSVMARISDHVKDPARRDHIVRVAVHECASADDMDKTEERLILAHRPRWNISRLPAEVKAARLHAKHSERRARKREEAEAAHKALMADPQARFAMGYYLSAADVASLLGCTVGVLRQFIANGQLRSAQRTPRSEHKFRPEWLVEFAAKHPELVPNADLPRVAS